MTHTAMLLLPLLPLLAATTVEAADAVGGGWVGTGLLGSVLAWLMFVHLPSKDKLLKESLAAKDAQLGKLLEDKDGQITHLLDHKWAAMAAMSGDHKDAIKALAAEFRAVVVEGGAHCDREIGRLLDWIGRLEKGRPFGPGAGDLSSKDSRAPQEVDRVLDRPAR